MYIIRKSEDRGVVDHGWLISRHTFSFGDYNDPNYMGFKSLRVINEDRVAGGGGFDEHSHRDMEIISYVVSGALQHKDSMGNTTIIKPGEIQVMSAGTGVVHSEMNHLSNQTTHFYQIWVLPKVKGQKPSYAQKTFNIQSSNIVHLISNDGQNGTIAVKQDVNIYISFVQRGRRINLDLQFGAVWIQVNKGKVKLYDQELFEGDAVCSEVVTKIELEGAEDSEVMIFDLK